MTRLDLSTPDLTRMAVRRALNNRTETRRLLTALGACRSGRRRYAGKTFSEAFARANVSDLYWANYSLRVHLYPSEPKAWTGVLDRLTVIASQLHPRHQRRENIARAKLYRAWFNPNGELKREWNL